MSAPNLYAVAAAARTRRIRLGGMGHIVPLHHPLRLVEEIALADQMLEGRLDVGLVPGILPDYFGPFGVDYASRREVTIEFVSLLKRACSEKGVFDFDGRFHKIKGAKLAVNSFQNPHPPLWLETRDPDTLAFCAKEGLNTGYFLLFPRDTAAPRYRKFLEQWHAAGWTQRPNIAYSTVVYVDETDEKAIKTALHDASRAYAGLFPPSRSESEFRAHQEKLAGFFEGRGEPGAADVVRHLTDPDYLMRNELILIGSPDTVATKLRAWATTGMFNTFFGEFNFGNLADADLMRSIRLFGTEVMPRLRGFEPY